MSATGFGLYTDSAKTITIIESRGNFKAIMSEPEEENAGEYRMTEGALESWKIWSKKSFVLRCSGIRQSDFDDLRTEYDLQREIVLYPDVYNLLTTYYTVKWARGWNPSYNKKDERYSLIISLRQV